MIYTDEQYKIIRQAEPHFESVKRDFIRNAPKWLTEQIINVYEIATKKTILNKDLNCSICVMNIYKLIGKTYDKDKKERLELAKKVEVKPKSEVVVESKESKPKKTSKKKTKKI